MIFQSVCLIAGTPDLWPFLILLEAIPAATSLIILPFLPETARYMLLVKKDRDAARKSEYYFLISVNPVNDTGANMHQVLRLIANCRV